VAEGSAAQGALSGIIGQADGAIAEKRVKAAQRLSI
jgi:hypothetical protein